MRPACGPIGPARRTANSMPDKARTRTAPSAAPLAGPASESRYPKAQVGQQRTWQVVEPPPKKRPRGSCHVPRHPGAGDVAIISVRGDLTDWRAIQQLQASCEAVQCQRRRMQLDLQGVHAADSKLLAFLVIILGQARASGVPLELRTSSCVRRWSEVCGLRDLINAPAQCRADPS